MNKKHLRRLAYGGAIGLGSLGAYVALSQVPVVGELLGDGISRIPVVGSAVANFNDLSKVLV